MPRNMTYNGRIFTCKKKKKKRKRRGEKKKKVTMSVARDPSDRSRARKRMQRTRIITIFDRYNVFKSCRETTTILYAGARMFIIRDTFVIRTFESLLLNH